MRPSACQRLFALCTLLGLAACHTGPDWQEMPVSKLPMARIYNALETSAQTEGYTPSQPDCDRGLGRYQSRWRQRAGFLGHPCRFRLRAEIEPGGKIVDGWLVRWCVEQEQVKDLTKSAAPARDDWSKDGQDVEREAILGELLRKQLRLDEAQAAKAPAN